LVAMDYVSKWVEAILFVYWFKTCQENVPWSHISSLWCTPDGHKRWRIPLHR
jgi:hypothetical protein